MKETIIDKSDQTNSETLKQLFILNVIVSKLEVKAKSRLKDCCSFITF